MLFFTKEEISILNFFPARTKAISPDIERRIPRSIQSQKESAMKGLCSASSRKRLIYEVFDALRAQLYVYVFVCKILKIFLFRGASKAPLCARVYSETLKMFRAKTRERTHRARKMVNKRFYFGQFYDARCVASSVRFFESAF